MGGGFFCLAEDKTFPIDWEIVLIVTGMNQLVFGEKGRQMAQTIPCHCGFLLPCSINMDK